MSAREVTVLDRIVAETRDELARRKRELPLVPAQPGDGGGRARRRRFRDALSGEGVGVIAEFKRRSPSAGSLHEAPDLVEIVKAYERGGAPHRGPQLRRLAG
jgi:indole-3-glycerol phosphate synthase